MFNHFFVCDEKEDGNHIGYSSSDDGNETKSLCMSE